MTRAHGDPVGGAHLRGLGLARYLRERRGIAGDVPVVEQHRPERDLAGAVVRPGLHRAAREPVEGEEGDDLGADS